MNTDLHFSSKTDQWATPRELFDQLDAVWGFELDVCALPSNAKCEDYFTPEQDGLQQSWGQRTCWMNPPYGREIKAWMRKAVQEWEAGAKVVCLVPSRTDTAWWHDYAMQGKIHFIRGRLKFGNAKNPAPFPSALVFFP